MQRLSQLVPWLPVPLENPISPGPDGDPNILTALRLPRCLPVPPKPRRVVRWIMTAPDNINTEDTTRLKEILARCPELAATAGHVRDLRGDRLGDWMHRVQTDDLPALHSFVTGIKRDQDAVVNGLSPSWNSGAVEGAVTRNSSTTWIRAGQPRPAPPTHPPSDVGKITLRHPFTLPVPEPNYLTVDTLADGEDERHCSDPVDSGSPPTGCGRMLPWVPQCGRRSHGH
jgi:hypothetical protein